MNQKGFIPLFILIAILVVGTAGGVYYLIKTNKFQSSPAIPTSNLNAINQSPSSLESSIAASLSSASATPATIKPTPNVFPGLTNPVANTSISDQEKNLIDLWIQKNSLNNVGDPKDTMYAGGSPLFSESTGKTIDRYQYIVSKHPDKHWNSQ